MARARQAAKSARLMPRAMPRTDGRGDQPALPVARGEVEDPQRLVGRQAVGQGHVVEVDDDDARQPRAQTGEHHGDERRLRVGRRASRTSVNAAGSSSR